MITVEQVRSQKNQSRRLGTGESKRLLFDACNGVHDARIGGATVRKKRLTELRLDAAETLF